MKLTLIPVAPIGKRTTFAHVAYANKPHEWGPVEIDEYPPLDPRATELTRLRLDHPTLQRRPVANTLGISPADHSALENGRVTLSDEEWAWALWVVRELAGGPR